MVATSTLIRQRESQTLAMQTTVAATDSLLCGTLRSSSPHQHAMAPASSMLFVVVVVVAEGSAFKARSILPSLVEGMDTHASRLIFLVFVCQPRCLRLCVRIN